MLLPAAISVMLHMASCAQLSIFYLLLSMVSAQRVCITANTTGVAAVCEATLGSNWTLLCAEWYHQQNRNRTLVTWRLPGGKEFIHENSSMTLINLSYQDAGVYSCAIGNFSSERTDRFANSSIKLLVKQGRAPQLLHDNKSQQELTAAGCQGSTQVVKGGLVHAMVVGYPSPAVMWFSDVKRTSRITNDNTHQLLPSGDLFVGDLGKIKQGQNTLYITAVNEFGMKRYCVHLLRNSDSNSHYHTDAVKSDDLQDLAYYRPRHHCGYSGSFCRVSCPTHSFNQWHLILVGLCLGHALLVFVIILMALVYCKLYYLCCYCRVQVDRKSDEESDITTDASSKTELSNETDFVYVVYSPQSEQWVEHTLMYKLTQWQLPYTTYELSAIPGQPKIVERLRLCSAAHKIIIVLAVDSLTEDGFLSEVLHVVSNEQTKVVPVLCGVSEVELEKNMIYRSIMTYVCIHHTDVNFDIRLRQALINVG